MSTLAFTSFQPVSRQLVSNEPEVLTQIFSPDVNLVSWQQHSLRAITTYCQQLTLAMPLKRIVSIDSAQAAPFAITLLKGSGWEGNEKQAIVHRSPAAALPRLLLTLDPM